MVEKPNDGRKLEKLVSALERALASSNAKIESPSRRLTDKDTGKPREHDVLISWDHKHHQIFTAIECRDRSRPVGVPAVEAFADKCSATGVHAGVIVSASGFTSTARTKAEKRNILCMDLQEAESLNWARVSSFTQRQRQFSNTHISLNFAGETPTAIGKIYDGTGEEVSLKQLERMIFNSIPHNHDQGFPAGEEIRVNVVVNARGKGWAMVDHDEKTWDIDSIKATTSYKVVEWQAPANLVRYSGAGREIEAVSLDFENDDYKGKFIMHLEDDKIVATFVPEKK